MNAEIFVGVVENEGELEYNFVSKVGGNILTKTISPRTVPQYYLLKVWWNSRINELKKLGVTTLKITNGGKYPTPDGKESMQRPLQVQTIEILLQHFREKFQIE